ncbi:uncharacterized protein BP5553_08379 [Venustampulla echinocandica]|uniref:MARVEL domain-containing protein n=1 Tax=Venustampulla echinocandica TaxID=2656787 RepID=A0A370TE54_9HELO|nr:uncharacterized protein BP5553_08379 [Venustampulla echinocandica]RDL32940.1 hypothetical protein BP5553_08379 [Venustampulla echinocandica]
MPKGLSILPCVGLLLAIVALGLSISGLVMTRSVEPLLSAMAYVLVVALATITVLTYLISTEHFQPRFYNYYVVLALIFGICLLSILAGTLTGIAIPRVNMLIDDSITSRTLIIVLRAIAVVFTVNAILFVVYWIMLAVLTAKHRNAGGHSRYQREHLRSLNRSYSSTQVLPAQVQSDAAEFTDTSHELTDTSHEFRRHTLRGSVHYKGIDPYHPLRINPPASDSSTAVSQILRKMRRRGVAYELPTCFCQVEGNRDGDVSRPGCHICAPGLFLENENEPEFQKDRKHDAHGQS